MSSPADRKVVILDVDGTLVDSNDAHARAWLDAFSEAGLLVDREQVRRAIGMGGDKLLPRVSGLSEESPEGSRISDRRGEIFKSRYLPHLQPFPHARDLVQRLIDDGFTIAVASSAKEDELEELLERAGVADLIERQTSSDDADRSKPDPDIVKAALERSKASPDAAVMIGDTPYDVEAALRAGITVVGVESGGWWREDLGGATEVYADMADLYHQYDQSIFCHLGPRGTLDRRPTALRRTDVRLMALVAAGIVGIALLALTVRALRHRRPRVPEDPGYEPRPGLSKRDRERLRYLIERTS